ncbi:hypothetical protein [Tepidibacillus sp. HK-1]|uniref:hypothetical protein n=1 Tax=Tepidibacillus sp. HK-1 TaxID=1883407 RepID=UPI0008556BB5|nr:hypothetical protein [Tepidibacillus sp. HK-1]GBF10022.1 hypothetical protein HK1_00034 [Tepidibacillus sp. HK-1]
MAKIIEINKQEYNEIKYDVRIIDWGINMLQTIMNYLNDIGMIGLFIAMFIKGSTLPLPSLIFIVSYGYLLNPTKQEMIWLAIGMSLTFTVASYIPYMIGFKLEQKIQIIANRFYNSGSCGDLFFS